MTGGKKPKSRAERNLTQAVASRVRKKKEKQRAQAEEAYLRESNAILRMELHLRNAMASGACIPAPRPQDAYGDGVVLPEDLSNVLGQRTIAPEAVVDLWDRVATGDAGKGPPKDLEAYRHWRAAEAASRTPRSRQGSEGKE